MASRRAATWAVAGLVALVIVTTLASLPARAPFINSSGTFVACCLVGWATSVRMRVVHARLRLLLSCVAALLCLLVVIQMVRYSFTDPNTPASRLTWYAYYVPLSLVPPVAVLCAVSIGTSDTTPGPERWARLLLPATALCLVFLTNDLHQLAFRFPSGAGPWLDDTAQHGPAYYVAAVWGGAQVFAALAVAVVRCGRVSVRQDVPLVLSPLVFGTAYLIAYALNGSAPPVLWGIRGPQFQAVCCLMAVAFCEALIQLGVIPSNSDYVQLFQAARFPALIMDASGAVRYQTSVPLEATADAMAHALHEPVPLDRVTQLHAMPIPGGSVAWTVDLSGVVASRERLDEARMRLREDNELLGEQAKLAEEGARFQIQARLYERTAYELEPQLQQIEALVRSARQSTDSQDERRVLGRLALLGAYVKRRANLAIVAEQRGSVPSDELVLALGESLGALGYSGGGSSMETSVAHLGGSDIPTGQALAAYDAFHSLASSLQDPMAGTLSVMVDARDGLCVRLAYEGGATLAWPVEAVTRIGSQGGVTSMQEEDGVSYASALWRDGDAR